MQVNIDEVIKWCGIIGASGALIWRFFIFSKQTAAREADIDNQITVLRSDQTAVKNGLEETRRFHTEYQRSQEQQMQEMSRRFEDRLEKQDEKHTRAFDKSIAEVKEMITKTDEKVDKLIELMLRKNNEGK